MTASYKFSVGPWNLSEGADPFGPAVRPSLDFAKKIALFRQEGFDAVMFHDDDAVPNVDAKSASEAERDARNMKQMLADQGMVVELIAPRLWEDPRGVDGGYTANDPAVRKWAIERSKRCIDLANVLGTDIVVLWLAREGTYIREAKDVVQAHRWLLEAIDAMLAHDPKIRLAIEPKPNEPMDQAFIPTIGHAMAIASQASDPKRVGGLIESAHAILAGLDPSDEMAFALSMKKLWSVHLNDQNGLKYDQDKTFGSVNLRSAFNQVRVLEQADFASTGAMVAFDVKAMRTTKTEIAAKHLGNNRRVFLDLVEKVRTFDEELRKQCLANRDYEALEMAILEHLMGVRR